MANQSLVERKLEASIALAHALVARGSPLLAAYWEWREENDRWVLFLVPISGAAERKLLDDAFGLLAEPEYRSMFSLGDVLVTGRQIKRARALGAYIQTPSSVGQRIDTLFTGGEFFEAVVPVFLQAELVNDHVA